MTPLLHHIALFALVNLLLFTAGFSIIKHKWVLASWLGFIVAIGAVSFIFYNDMPVIKMLAIIATTFTAMKIVAVLMEYQKRPMPLTFIQWGAFVLGWFGMKAKPFETFGGPALSEAASFIRYGISRLFIGAILITLAHFAVKLPLDTSILYPIVSVILLIGFSFVLHFGILSISAGLLRLAGADTYPLFRSPLRSLSLSEFWAAAGTWLLAK